MKSVSETAMTVRQGVTLALREGFTAGEGDGWLPGFRPEVFVRVTVVLAALWIAGNLSLLGQMLQKPDLDPDMARLSVHLMNGIIVVECAIWIVFLRKWRRGYEFFFGLGCMCLMAVALVWIQMTGTVTSYFFGVMGLNILGVRVLGTYRLALVVTVLTLLAHATMYVLELRGVLPYAPLVRGGMGVTPGYRELAASSMLMMYPFGFVTANVMAKFVRRQKAALDQARSELRRAADQARLGRLSGTRLGDYSVEDLLGRGGMGEVYAAKRVKDGKEFAIKLLHAHLGSEDKMRARFRREAEVVGKMPAGTVAAVHQFGTTEEGYDYIVMDRLRGEDLGALLRRRERLEPAEVVALMDRVAVGLDAAHAAGVVHRDLKPQNIFLCGSGEGDGLDVRLLDFGVARLHEAALANSMTATAAVLGTPGYMPPEQASGGEVGPSADTFALGAIAYRALTGKPAFPSRSPAGALFEARYHDPTPPSHVVGGLSRDVDAVLALALAKDPAARYQQASELARDLAAALRGELTAATQARAAALGAPAEAATMTAG